MTGLEKSRKDDKIWEKKFPVMENTYWHCSINLKWIKFKKAARISGFYSVAKQNHKSVSPALTNIYSLDIVHVFPSFLLPPFSLFYSTPCSPKSLCSLSSFCLPSFPSLHRWSCLGVHPSFSCSSSSKFRVWT